MSITRRTVLVILLFGLVAATAAFVVSSAQTPLYTAKASLLFRDPGFDDRFFGATSVSSGDANREAATNVDLVSLDIVAERTAERLPVGSPTSEEIAKSVTISQDGLSNVVGIEVTDPDPEQAAAVANAFAAAYVRFRQDADRAQVANAREQVIANYESIQEQAGDGRGPSRKSPLQQISQLETLEALQTGNAEVVAQAETPSEPSSPKTFRNTVLALLFGLLVGGAGIATYARLDRRLRTAEAVGSAFEAPLLANIPTSSAISESREPASPASPGGPELEAFRMLRSRLRYFNVDRELKVVAVTSSIPGEGKSTIALNLGLAGAAAGQKVLMVEGDFHEPVLAARHGVAPIPGLSELLTGQADIESATQLLRSVSDESPSDPAPREGLWVIASGATPPNPVELVESQEMGALLDRLRGQFELIVLDCPPALLVADALGLLRHADGVLVVSEIGRATRDDAAALKTQLSQLDVLTLGVVANRDRAGRAYGGYGYGYNLAHRAT